VLEFGAGIGTLALEWRRQTHAAPECVELDPEQADLVRQRGFVCRASIGELSRTYDMVYTSNVLEHIEDDRRALAELHSVLREGGVIAIFVPAFMCLYSDADRALGHYRRYQRRELLEKVETAGFAVVDCHFVDSLGFFAWLATRIFGYRAGADLGDDRSLMFYDKWLYPVSRRLDRLGLRHLFGKNILVVARKQGR
jgi:SAM-dependent methyltransferase